MAVESIRVYFQPLLAVGGKTFHHETLIYTNSDGQQFYATAYAPKNPAGEDLGTSSGKATIGSDFGAASSAAATNGASPYGTIVTQWGRVDDLSPGAQRRLLGPPDRPYDSQILKVGDDLSGNWSKTVQAYYQVGEQGLPYSPASQNSNSAGSTGLTAGDVPLPTGTGFKGQHWAPASDVILPTSMTPARPTPAFQPDAVYSPTGDFYGNFPRASAIAATPSPAAFNASGPGSGPWITDALNAAGKRAVPVLTRVGKFIGDSLITPAEGASPSGPLLRDPTAPNLPGDETQGIDSSKPARRLGRRIVNPSAGVPGDSRSSQVPQPQESQGPLSLTDAYLQYLSRLNENMPQASMFDSAAPTAPFDASDRNPPGRSVADWIASLAGVDPQNPAQLASSPQTRGLAGSSYGGNPVQQRTGEPIGGAPDNSVASSNDNRNWYTPLGGLLWDGNRSRAPEIDSGVPASPLVSSDNANYSGGLLGRFAALAGLDSQNPNQPAPPLDDEQEQADLQTLEAELSSSGNIRDAVALYNARKSNRR